MSKTIDQRVVEMQFDNKHFENNVQTSLSTLDKLKKSLNLDDASKGFDNLDKAAKNVNMSGLSDAAETVRAKFSALEVIAVTALVNITNAAMKAGVELVKSLTIDQITAGFTKYEQKTQAIQTIMAATGKGIDEVNNSLEKLNWFTDETSYNLLDMTNNIGKFTSNGVDLDLAVTAMQGIANSAALSGAGIENASHAMEGFSKAIAQGNMTRQNWNWVKTARMDTQQFKESMIEAGLAAGTLVQVGDNVQTAVKGTAVSFQDFESAMSEGWMTTEVILDALGSYGGFTDKLFEASEKTNMTASVLLESIDKYKDGTLDLSEVSRTTGLSVAELTEMFDELSNETFGLGEKSFRAAQEAKTFAEAIDSVKDAVSTGWMTTFEHIFGNYEEAKELWTDLANEMYDLFAEGGNSRNEMLAAWKELGGRNELIEAFWNIFHAITDVVSVIKGAWDSIFPPKTAEQLFSMTQGLKEFTEKLKMSDETTDKLQRTFAGLFAVLDLVKQGFGFLFNVATSVFSLFGGPAVGSVLDLTAKLGDLLVAFRDSVNASGFFTDALGTLRGAFTAVVDKVKDAVSRVKEAFGGFGSIDTTPLTQLGEKLEVSTGPFERVGKIFGAAFEAIVKVLEWAAPIVAKLGSIIGQGLSKLADIVSNAVMNLEFNEIFDLVNSGLFAGILFGFKKFIDSLTEITSGAGGFLDNITGILDGVRGSLQAYQSNLKAKTLMTIAAAIGILAAALVVLSLIDSEKLTTALMGITVLFVELSAAMIVIQKSLGGGKMAGVSVQMVAMGTAILILSAAMKNLASLDWEGIAKGTVGIAALAATLVIAANSFDKSSGKLIKGATGLIAFAAAILIMSKAVENLSGLSWGELALGLTGLTVILAEVVAITHLMGDSKRMVSTGVGMIALGAAMLIFAEAIERMGQLSWGEIARGLTTMAGALTAVTLAMNLLPKGMVSKATGMVVMGSALLIIANAVSQFGSMQWDEIARGLTALAGSLTAITLAMNLLPKDMVGKSVGLVGVATALNIMIGPLQQMAGMTWEEIAKGLVALAGSLTILAVALNAMQKAIPGAAAMLIVAPALVVMAGALKILGSMPLSEIGVGLLALAGTFTVLGLAALVLQPLVPTMIGLAGAITLLGVGVAAVGIGVLAFATALTALSVSATAAAGAIVIIGSAILSLIPIFFEKIGEGLIALGNVTINGAPIIKDAFLVLLASALEAITEAAPMVAEAVLSLLVSLLDVLVQYTPTIVEQVFDLLIGILNAIAQKLPLLIQVAVDVLMSFFAGVVDALSGIDVDVLVKGIAGIGLLSAIMLALSAVASLIPGAMVGVLGMGLVIAELALVLAAIGALAQIPGLSWLIGEGGKLLEGIGLAIGSFVGGIVGGFMSGVSSQFPQIGADLSAFMENVTPFIEGAAKIDASMMEGVQSLAKTILLLTAADILDGLTSWFTGGSSLTDFGAELAEFGPYFNDYYESVKGIDGGVVQASANAALTMAEFASKLPNQGGVASWFAGENSLSVFAEELAEFGPILKQYADSVTGLNANVVENSANAALALAEMANNLPNQGGAVSWFTGDNTLSVFAEELVEFGPKLKEYADSVHGLDAGVVVNSANAAIALSEMAANLPNQGGVASWFAGDNTLSVFGEELATFGPHLKSYADSVLGLDAGVVVNSANAAKALSELATNLPNSGGLVSLFTGDNDIASFGTKLVSFGESFAAYYASVSTVNCDQLSSVVVEFKSLVDLANGISGVDTSGMSRFGQDLTALGNSGIDGFINAFKNANSRVTDAAKTMLTTFINGANAQKSTLTNTFTSLVNEVLKAINNNQANFQTAGQTLMVKFIAGVKTQDATARTTFTNIISGCLTAIKNKYGEFTSTGSECMVKFIAGVKSQDTNARTTFTNIISGCLTAIKNKYSEFTSTGSECMVKFIAGVKSKESAAKEAFTTILSSILSAIKDSYNDFYSAGDYLVQGFAKGIDENTFKAEAAARAMAKAAAKAAKKELDEHSPSRVGYQIGDFFGQGFVNAIIDYESKASDAGSSMAGAAVDGLNYVVSKIADFIDGDMDVEPTIRPVLDLSNVESGASRLNALFSRTQAMSISNGTNWTNDDKIQNGIVPPVNERTYQFVQNNYSPKALSRVEIYRQTKNLFSASKEVVSNA